MYKKFKISKNKSNKSDIYNILITIGIIPTNDKDDKNILDVLSKNITNRTHYNNMLLDTGVEDNKYIKTYYKWVINYDKS